MRALCRRSALALLALLPLGALALGKPDWAKPHLTRPTPAGAYIAKNDGWVVVYGEVLYGLYPGGALREEHRVILENLWDKPQALSFALEYDEGAVELRDIAINVDRVSHWQTVNLSRTSARATRKNADQLVFTSLEEVEANRRVVLEYTFLERYDVRPWLENFTFGRWPISELRVGLAPDAPENLKVLPVLPEGDALPASITPDGKGAWIVRSVPARDRIPTGYAAQPGMGDLYPWFVAYSEPRGARDEAFIERYAQEWERARKAQDPGAVAARAQPLVAGADSPLAKARRIADFVQHKVQYDDSNVNSINGWVPLQADETLRSLKGDCKGKTLLAQSMLQAVGIESRPVLLRLDEAYFSWRAEPATSRLNHVILAVRLEGGGVLPATLQEGPAAGWVLFDPVVETASFGEPLPGYEGFPAFLVGGAGPPRFTIRTKEPSAERLKASVRYTFDGFGSIGGVLTLRDNGACWLSRRLAETFNLQDIQNLVLEAFPAALNRVQVQRIAVRRAGEGDTAQMEAEIVFRLPGASQSMASSILLENPMALPAHLAGVPNGYWPPTPPGPDDKVEVVAPWDNKKNAHGVEFVMEVEATVELPIGYTWSPPPGRQEKTPATEYDCTWTQAGDLAWKGTLRLTRHRGSWPAADRKARLKFEDALFSGIYKPLELQKK